MSSLDLSNNQLIGKEDFVSCLGGIQQLTSLNMDGNPIKLAHCRKKVIVACKLLKYLDRPVFADERERAKAWAIGGHALEFETKEKLLMAKREEARRATEAFRTWQEEEVKAMKDTQKEEDIIAGEESKDEVVIVEEEEVTNRENIEPPPPPLESNITAQQEDKDVSSRRIRDSLAIMKSGKQRSVVAMWSTRIEMRLLELAAEKNHDFAAVAASLSEEFGSSTFYEHSCARRWALLDLNSSANTTEADIKTTEDEFVCPQTDRELSYFTKGSSATRTPMFIAPEVSTLPCDNESPSAEDMVMHRSDWEKEFKSEIP